MNTSHTATGINTRTSLNCTTSDKPIKESTKDNNIDVGKASDTPISSTKVETTTKKPKDLSGIILIVDSLKRLSETLDTTSNISDYLIIDSEKLYETDRLRRHCSNRSSASKIQQDSSQTPQDHNTVQYTNNTITQKFQQIQPNPQQGGSNVAKPVGVSDDFPCVPFKKLQEPIHVPHNNDKLNSTHSNPSSMFSSFIIEQPHLQKPTSKPRRIRGSTKISRVKFTNTNPIPVFHSYEGTQNNFSDTLDYNKNTTTTHTTTTTTSTTTNTDIHRNKSINGNDSKSSVGVSSFTTEFKLATPKPPINYGINTVPQNSRHTSISSTHTHTDRKRLNIDLQKEQQKCGDIIYVDDVTHNDNSGAANSQEYHSTPNGVSNNKHVPETLPTENAAYGYFYHSIDSKSIVNLPVQYTKYGKIYHHILGSDTGFKIKYRCQSCRIVYDQEDRCINHLCTNDSTNIRFNFQIPIQLQQERFHTPTQTIPSPFSKPDLGRIYYPPNCAQLPNNGGSGRISMDNFSSNSFTGTGIVSNNTNCQQQQHHFYHNQMTVQRSKPQTYDHNTSRTLHTNGTECFNGYNLANGYTKDTNGYHGNIQSNHCGTNGNVGMINGFARGDLSHIAHLPSRHSCRHSGCGETFRDEQQLRLHQLAVETILLPCEYCDFVFENRDIYISHLVSRHSGRECKIRTSKTIEIDRLESLGFFCPPFDNGGNGYYSRARDSLPPDTRSRNCVNTNTTGVSYMNPWPNNHPELEKYFSMTHTTHDSHVLQGVRLPLPPLLEITRTPLSQIEMTRSNCNISDPFKLVKESTPVTLDKPILKKTSNNPRKPKLRNTPIASKSEKATSKIELGNVTNHSDTKRNNRKPTSLKRKLDATNPYCSNIKDNGKSGNNINSVPPVYFTGPEQFSEFCDAELLRESINQHTVTPQNNNNQSEVLPECRILMDPVCYSELSRLLSARKLVRDIIYGKEHDTCTIVNE